MDGIHITTTAQLSIFILVPLAVGALFTFLSTIVASRTASANADRQIDLTSRVKLADYRQNWINDLRDSFAELQSCALTNKFTDVEMPKLYLLSAKIHLLMNREDLRYAKVSGAIMAITNNANPEGRARAVQELTALAQDVLKTEWEVLKVDLRYKKEGSGK